MYRLNNFSFYISPKIEKNDYEKVCEEECCEEDSIDSNSINSLNLYSNRAEILLNVINYSLEHMTFTADDLGELSGIYEKIYCSLQKLLGK